MKVSNWLSPAVALVLAGSVWAAVQEKKPAPHDMQPQTREAKAARAGKLTKPWSEMSSLTDEQKQQIEAVHGAAAAEVKRIQEKEHDDIMALLSEPQKAELKEMLAKQAAEKKAAKGSAKNDRRGTSEGDDHDSATR